MATPRGLEATLRQMKKDILTLKRRRSVVPSNDPTLSSLTVSGSTDLAELSVTGNTAVGGNLSVGPTSELSTAASALMRMNGQNIFNAGGTSQRDALDPNPEQGDLCYRLDMNWLEMYYDLSNPAGNPGGASVAGWYPIAGALPRIKMWITTLGIAQIAQRQYCFSVGNGYLQTPNSSSGYVNQMTMMESGGKITCPILGRFRVRAHVWLAGSSSQTGLQVGVTKNCPTSPTTAPNGSVIQLGGLEGFMETPTNPDIGHTNELDVVVTTNAVSDYLQFWFGSSVSANTDLYATAGAPGCVTPSPHWLSVEYVGPPVTEF